MRINLLVLTTVLLLSGCAYIEGQKDQQAALKSNGNATVTVKPPSGMNLQGQPASAGAARIISPITTHL